MERIGTGIWRRTDYPGALIRASPTTYEMAWGFFDIFSTVCLSLKSSSAFEVVGHETSGERSVTT